MDYEYGARFLFGDDMPRGKVAREKFFTGRLLFVLFAIDADPHELTKIDYIACGDLLHAAKTRMQVIKSCGLLRALERLRAHDAAFIVRDPVLVEHQRQLARATP